jgi:lipoyl(octanoyl) transferase
MSGEARGVRAIALPSDAAPLPARTGPRRVTAADGAPALQVRDLGRMPYRAAWALQKQLVQARLDGTAPDTLLLVEHEPVITVGRGTKGAFLASGVLRAEAQPGDAVEAVFVALPGGARAEVIEVERGGQATYHGPGQLVAYPIVKLAEGRRDLHAWMRALEQVVIDALADTGLAAGRKPGATGVWVDGRRKLCSIGVAASRWVTYHGLALNVDPDLAHFAAINPCGFDAAVMTSVVQELPGVDAGRLRDALATQLVHGLAGFEQTA